MFGKNTVMKQDLGVSSALRVVEGSPFYTIQGEGPFMGHPAVFIRLHGCNLRCWFCDTEFSNPSDPTINTVRLARVAYDMAKFEAHGPCSLIVITGGEPFRQNILPLCQMLLKQGMIVQIETAGTLWIDGIDELLGVQYGNRFHIVCSPKTPTIHKMIYKYATAFKYVVGQKTSVIDGVVYANTQHNDGRPAPLASARPGAPVYLSPMDEYDELINAENRKRVASLCLRNGYIAGVQMHKLLEIKEP